MTETPANIGKLSFSTKPTSARKSLATIVYTALAAVSILFGTRMFHGLDGETFQLLLAIAVSLAFMSLIEILAGRATTEISVSDDRVVVQKAGVVSGNFLLSEIANIEHSPSPLGSTKITTNADLVFRIPTEGLSAEDRNSLDSILRRRERCATE